MAKLINKEQTELDKFKTILFRNPNISQNNKEFIKKCNPKNYNFGGEENFIVLLNAVIDNNNLRELDFEKVLIELQEIYKQFELVHSSFKNFLSIVCPNGIYEKKIFSVELLVNFEQVENYLLAMAMVIDNEIALKNFSETTRLILSLGIYTPNDIELNALLAYFLKTPNFANNYEELVDKTIDLAKKRAGIYDDLSEDYLAKLEATVQKSLAALEITEKEEKHIKSLAEKLHFLRLECEKNLKSFEESISRADKAMKQSADNHIAEIEQKYIDAYASLRNDYESLARKLVAKSDAEAKKAALNAVENLEKTATELSRVKSQYQLKTSDELANIERIRDVATSEVRKGLEEIKNLLKGLGEDVDLSKLGEILQSSASSNIVLPQQTIIAPIQTGIVVAENPTDIKVPEILSSFDETISFKKRYKDIMNRKKALENKGVIYNKAIDDCIYFLLRNFYIYLYGPSGSGKNYFVKQLSDLFENKCINIGYITEEYDIVGGKTANGFYSPTNFYNCWTNGYFAFANELDASIPQATVKLNEFLDSEVGETFSFPGLGFIPRHANFRVIAAGNTKGNGANHAYNARQKFDESIQQRFKYVKFDFDPRVEKDILKDNMEWYEFAMLFRNALIENNKGNENAIEGQITTRNLRDISTEIKDDILGTEKILDYEFIKTKEIDCLSYIKEYMKKNDTELSSKTKSLVKKYGEIIEKRKKTNNISKRSGA